MKGKALFGLLGVALLVGSTVAADEPTLFDVRFSSELSPEHHALLKRSLRKLDRISQRTDPKSAFESLFREHSKAFRGVETDYLYFFLLATAQLHAQGLLPDDGARESAELFKAWWSARVLGLSLPKGPITAVVRNELLAGYDNGRHLVRLWTRFDYPRSI